MQTYKVDVDRFTAREIWRRYRDHPSFEASADKEIRRCYQLLAQGKLIIKALESVKRAGLDEQGRPNLAICRADAEHCWLDMGHNGNATEGTRMTVEMIRAGVIGDIKEIHTWTNRPIWPQGIERPLVEPTPTNLNWDLWLGPAPERPYNHIYHPFNWRGWVDFGTGALGDMGCHIINASYWALNLGYPDSVEAGCWFNGETYPDWSIIRYQFPANNDRPAVKMFWYDGGKLPERPKELEADRQFALGGGTLWIGDKGKMITATSQAPRLIPESKMKDFVKPPQTIERLPVGPSPHHREWLDAIKSGKESSANFQYSAMLTEIVLLGNVAIRARKKVEWDGPNMKVKGMPEAEPFIKREYRKGWSL